MAFVPRRTLAHSRLVTSCLTSAAPVGPRVLIQLQLSRAVLDWTRTRIPALDPLADWPVPVRPACPIDDGAE